MALNYTAVVETAGGAGMSEMNDYISREWLLAEYDRRHKGPPGGMRQLIKEAPAADVRPVVHGKWIHETIDTHSSITGKVYLPSAICSICGNSTILDVNFCPYCGADMRRKEADK